jgi:hypothetical protein
VRQNECTDNRGNKKVTVLPAQGRTTNLVPTTGDKQQSKDVFAEKVAGIENCLERLEMNAANRLTSETDRLAHAAVQYLRALLLIEDRMKSESSVIKKDANALNSQADIRIHIWNLVGVRVWDGAFEDR